MTDLASFTTRPAGKLSGGMKQKLGLACTLVRSPDLLLLDEPSVGVDPLSRRELWVIVQQLIEAENLSVLVSTAYMDEAERCADVFVMHRGQILSEGAPATLRTRAHGLTFTATPPATTPARQFQARLFDSTDLILDAVPRGGAVRFITQPNAPDDRVDALLAPAAKEPRPEELEDAFMMMLRQSEGQQSRAAPPAPTVRHPHAHGSDEVVIAVRDLVRRFGDFTAVARTSFDVRRGEIFGLLGPNGAGKTTTFRMLCGLLPATSGQLEVAGVNLRTARAQARAHIGYMSQKFALYGDLQRAGEPGVLRRRLRIARAAAAHARRGGPRGIRSGAGGTQRRSAGRLQAAPGDGAQGCCTNPTSCFSTSRRAASIHWRAARSGGRSPLWPSRASR